MSVFTDSMRLGVTRAVIEMKYFFTNPQEVIWTVAFSFIFITVLWFQKDAQVEGLSLALFTLPSMLGMLVAQGGYSGTAGVISYEKEDGTLLRAKTLPQGMIAYVVSRVIYVLFTTLISLAFLLIPALFIVPGLPAITIDKILLFAGIFLLGLVATAPAGAVIGSIVKNANSGFGLTFLPMMGIVAISGIFYPITALAQWLQALAQVFPVYWVGLGMRSIFLPEAAVAAEIGQSWRPIETLVVLGIWAVIGMLVAPRVLKRMSRRATGSDMQARKDEMLQRGY